MINNKIHLTTKVFLFMVNYRRELRMGVDLRKKKKNRESNRVCRKNKKDIRRSRGSIDKSSGGNKETSG